nr:hypothetical protein [Tanacetum cinerariifolium]
MKVKVSNSDVEFVDVVVPEKKVTDFVSKKRIHSFMFQKCHIVLPQIQDNSCSKELHIAPVVGDLMAINEYSDVNTEGVADNFMPDVVIKEPFDDAEDYKVLNSDDLKDQMKFTFHIEADRETVISLGTSSICAQLSIDISSKNKLIDELRGLRRSEVINKAISFG